MLGGFQAGLSWTIILRRRHAFRVAFKNFDPEDVGVVRSRAKIEATTGGARAYLALQTDGNDFSTFIWNMAGGKPIQNSGAIQVKTPL